MVAHRLAPTSGVFDRAYTAIASRRSWSLVIAFWLLTVLPIGAVFADQRDPRLTVLFDRLKTADAVSGPAIEAGIWSIWFATPDKVAADLLDEGVTLMSRRRWGEALQRFDKLVERAPDFAEGWNKRATVYYLLGDLQHSVQDIEQTLVLEPRHFGALSGLGQIYLQRDQPEAALRVFEAALRVNPAMAGLKRQIIELRARIGGRDI